MSDWESTRVLTTQGELFLETEVRAQDMTLYVPRRLDSEFVAIFVFKRSASDQSLVETGESWLLKSEEVSEDE